MANNIASINIPVALCGVLGEDDSANLFKSIIQDSGINDHTYVDPEFQTIVKTRVIKFLLKQPLSSIKTFYLTIKNPFSIKNFT